MGHFDIIMVIFTLLVLVLSLCGSRYLAAGQIRRMIFAAIMLFDGGTVGFVLSNGWWGHLFTTSLIVSGIVIVITTQLIICVMVFLALLVRWCWRRMLQVPVDVSRRRLLKHAAVYPALAGGLSLYGGVYERSHTVERSYTIPVRAAGSMAGYRLAQISDIHLGLFFTTDDLRELLERTAAAGPDMLVITGDLFDDVSQNPTAARMLDDYVDRFRDGIWYCLGNHEYYRGLTEIRHLLAQTRVHALYNSAEQVPGQDFWVAGVAYAFARGETAFRQERQEYLTEALQEVPDTGRTLLLAHHPEFIDDAAGVGIPLTLTGHTHGGQFGLFGVPLLPGFKYTRGMVHIGSSYGYVHSGNGSWFPMRIGCPPEIAYFTLAEGE